MVFIFFIHLILGHNKLPIPCGVSGIERVITPATPRRMSKSNAVAIFEHQQTHEILNVTVMKRPRIAHARKILKKCIPTAILPAQLKVIAMSQHCAFIIILLSVKLHSHVLLGPPAALKVNALVSRSINIAGPEVPNQPHSCTC